MIGGEIIVAVFVVIVTIILYNKLVLSLARGIGDRCLLDIFNMALVGICCCHWPLRQSINININYGSISLARIQLFDVSNNGIRRFISLRVLLLLSIAVWHS